MPEHNLSAVFLSTIFFGVLRVMMKKVDRMRGRASWLILAASAQDWLVRGGRNLSAPISVRQTRCFRIENRIRAAYDSRDPQSSRMVSVTPPEVAFRLGRQGHR